MLTHILWPWRLIPSTAWLDRVLRDLSDLHDSEVLSERYFKRAWMIMALVSLVQELDYARYPRELRENIFNEVLHWLDADADSGAEAASLLRMYLDETIKGIDAVEEQPSLKRQLTMATSAQNEKSFDGNGTPARNRNDPKLPPLELIPGETIAGRRWKFHAADADPEPPPPHGHDLNDNRIKLDVYTGTVSGPNGTYQNASAKELARLWADKKFRSHATRARQYLLDTQPWRAKALPEMP
jgi:hypothetical protein